MGNAPRQQEQEKVTVTIPNTTIDENTTLGHFEKLCEDSLNCMKLRKVRRDAKENGNKEFKVGYFDYLIASLLIGYRDNKREAVKNYIYYTIFDIPELDKKAANAGINDIYSVEDIYSRLKIDKPQISQVKTTWKGRIENVKDKEIKDINDIYEAVLDADTTIAEVLEKYKKSEKGFNTINNEYIFKCWDMIKNIQYSQK